MRQSSQLISIQLIDTSWSLVVPMARPGYASGLGQISDFSVAQLLGAQSVPPIPNDAAGPVAHILAIVMGAFACGTTFSLLGTPL